MVKVSSSKITLLCLFLLFLSTKFQAQSKSVLEDEAYDHLAGFDYVKAYEAFDKLHARYPKELDYQFKLGICCLNYPEKKERAIELFLDMVAKNKTKESEYYLAKAYHSNYRFDDALAILRPLEATLKESKKKEDKDTHADVTVLINNCENGKSFTRNPANAVVRNIGGPINSKEFEAVPIITADESMMIFTYKGRKSTGGKMNNSLEPDPNGNYTADMYMSTKVNDSTWGSPSPITAINTKAEDAALAISPDGLTLYSFLSTDQSEGDILVSKLQGTEFSKPELLNSNVNTPEYWEGSCAISADGKYLYFSSDRPNGIGGRDLYVSEWMNDDWGPATNLGPNINTPLNEDDPFIHPDGVTLFFSSQGHSSMGGYDIMFSTKSRDGWSEVKNMGVPVNTTADDRFYVVNSAGDKGYFSSDRAIADSRGGSDIYMVQPGVLGDRLIVGLFKGTVYGDDKPVEARIDLVRKANNENIGPYYSNKSSGKYLITLKPGSSYSIKVFADGYAPIEETINAENMESYAEVKKDFYLYSNMFAGEKKSDPTKLNFPPEGAAAAAAAAALAASTPKPEEPKAPEPVKTPEPEPEVPAVVAAPVKSAPVKTEEPVAVKSEAKETTSGSAAKKSSSPCAALPDLSILKGKSLNDPGNYQMMLNLVGAYCADNVVFKVQVGAYRQPANFKGTQLKALGKIESSGYPDGITRFTLGKSKTIQDAEKLRQKAIARGQSDSWIVAFVDGNRYTLEDLIMLDFQGKAIN